MLVINQMHNTLKLFSSVLEQRIELQLRLMKTKGHRLTDFDSYILYIEIAKITKATAFQT